MTDPTELYPELLRLTERAYARLRDHDHDGLAALLGEREALVERIRRLGLPPDAPALTRILELDRAVLTLLEAEKARLAEALAQIAKCRDLLASYHGGAPRSAVYVETLG